MQGAAFLLLQGKARVVPMDLLRSKPPLEVVQIWVDVQLEAGRKPHLPTHGKYSTKQENAIENDIQYSFK